MKNCDKFISKKYLFDKKSNLLCFFKYFWNYKIIIDEVKWWIQWFSNNLEFYIIYIIWN